MRFSITHPAKIVLVLAIGAGAALLLAACGSDDESSSGSGAAEAATDSGVVSVQSIDGTDVLVDSDGRALYSADVEKGGRILCTGSCTADWDPVVASGDDAASADVDGDLGVVERPDRTEQLTFEDLPLYTFTQEGPGQLTGNGFVDEFNGTEFEWEAATAGAASGSTDPGGSSDDDGAGFSY